MEPSPPDPGLARRRRARARVVYLALAVGTIAAGLAVHKGGTGLPAAARDVTGDALWAAMWVWWLGALWPEARVRVRAGGALALAFAVELSQLYHSAAVDAVRRTALGHLVLGSDFDARDLVAYALGVAAAAALDRALRRRAGRRRAGLDDDPPAPLSPRSGA